MFDDLQRLFGYQGAIDERAGVTEVAPDLLVVPCWTPQFCATVVRAAEAVGAFEHQPDDPVPGHEVSLAVISPRLFETVQEDFGMRIWPQLLTVWPYVDYHGLRDAFVIRYAPGEQESMRVHHDVAQVSGSIKLNNDYSGAALVFPRQCFDNTEVGVGEMLVWPSLVTHPHEAAQLDSGVKYALTVWFELPSF
ncbi:MAG: hypothetical protein M3P52_07975 [Actinomycetota bacterium]|nr:hypothetical protein [Actinomycetota bacterium]